LLDEVLTYYGLTQEDIAPKRKTWKSDQVPHTQSKEDRNQAVSGPSAPPMSQRSGPQTSRKQGKDGTQVVDIREPKNDSDRVKSRDKAGPQPKKDDRVRSKENKGNGLDSARGQNLLIENRVAFKTKDQDVKGLPSQEPIPLVPKPLPYETLREILGEEVAKGKEHRVSGTVSGASFMATSIKTVSDSSESASKSLFSYRPAYYLSGAAVAGIAAMAGAMLYIWPSLKKSHDTNDDVDGAEIGKVKKRSPRLHAREWNLA
jgi:hypothetical protein